MSSGLRNIQRRNMRKSADYTPRFPYSKLQADGSILTLHPTRGWKRTCAARAAFRIEQGQLLAARLGLIAALENPS